MGTPRNVTGRGYRATYDQEKRRIVIDGPMHRSHAPRRARWQLFGPSCETVIVTATDHAAARTLWADYLIHGYGLCGEHAASIAADDFPTRTETGATA